MANPTGAAAKPKPRTKNGGKSGDRPPTVEDVTQRNVRLIERLEGIERRRRTALDRVADRISRFAGSTGFLVVHVLWFGSWVGYNAWAGTDAFDPYPFTFLTMVVSLEAIFLSTFILISQTCSARISDHRNRLDLQINLLSEQENTAMLAMLERIAEKLGIQPPGDAKVRAMEQPTRLEKVVQQLDNAERERRAS